MQLGCLQKSPNPSSPLERVDKTFVYDIDSIEIQRLGLTPTGDYDVIQHIELPITANNKYGTA